MDVGKKSLFKLLEKTVDVHNEDADEDITSIGANFQNNKIFLSDIFHQMVVVIKSKIAS